MWGQDDDDNLALSHQHHRMDRVSAQTKMSRADKLMRLCSRLQVDVLFLADEEDIIGNLPQVFVYIYKFWLNNGQKNTYTFLPKLSGPPVPRSTLHVTRGS